GAAAATTPPARPLPRLLLLRVLVLVLGVSLPALALALGTGPTPAPKPLAEAVHEALAAPAVDGVSARIKLTNHLVEGANLADGSGANQLASGPLLSGADGRLWIAKDSRVRLELQPKRGSRQIYYNGHTLSAYDASTNQLSRHVRPSQLATPQPDTPDANHEVPSVAKIEEAISKVKEHAQLSGAQPSDVAGQ